MSLSFEPLALIHQPVIDDLLRKHPPEVSELTFTNLFIWRHYYRFQVAFSQGLLTLLAHPPDQSPFFLPPLGEGDFLRWVETCLNYLKELGLVPCIGRLSKTSLDTLSSFPGTKAVLDRDNSDYVYHTRDLIQLSGNRYHTPKNHLNRFLKTHSWEYLSLTPQLVSECLDLQDEWCRLRQCLESPSLLSEEQAIIEALKHIDFLNYRGGVVRVDGKVEAFTLGELLNPLTVVIHIEKANPDLPGLYQLIQQQFLQKEWGPIPHVNREQDLGVEGLRKAKQSYHPAFMIDKFQLLLA